MDVILGSEFFFWFLPFIFFHCEFFLAFWFGGTAGKNFEEEVVVLQFCFNSRGVILVADSSFSFSFSERDSCSSETRFNAEASGGEHPPTTDYQLREEKENPSLERARPPARPSLQ